MSGRIPQVFFELVVVESHSCDTNCSFDSFEMVRELTRP